MREEGEVGGECVGLGSVAGEGVRWYCSEVYREVAGLRVSSSDVPPDDNRDVGPRTLPAEALAELWRWRVEREGLPGETSTL